MSSIDSEKNCASARRLKEERERIELSQEEFGLKLGITKRTIVNWEAGNSRPDLLDLVDMYEKFRMDTQYIITGVRTPMGVAQDISAYTPAEQASAELRSLKLTATDAEMIIVLARRLAVY